MPKRSSRKRGTRVSRGFGNAIRNRQSRRSLPEGIEEVRRRTENIFAGPLIRSTDAPRQRTRMAGNVMLSGLRNRRKKMQPRKGSPTAGLSKSVVLTPSRDGRTDASKTSPAGLCARRRNSRRAVVIATGYGGRNGVTDYRRHEKC